MAFEGKTKLVLLHDNAARADKLTSVTGTLSTDTNFPVTNLGFEDPGRLAKGASGLNGTIILNFSTSVTIGAIGFIRHNLWASSGVSITCSGLLAGSYSGNMEGNFALLGDFQGLGSSSITITISGTSGSTFIGSVWAGAFTEATINARDGQLQMIPRSIPKMDDSAAGAPFLVQAPDSIITDASYFTKRAKIADVRAVNLAQATNIGHLCGIVPPHEVDNVGVTAVGHAFGYIASVVNLPRSSYSADRRYDLQVNLQGV